MEEQSSGEHHTDPETFYCQIYYEAVDLITSSIKGHFDQEDFKIYVACEQLIINSLNDNDTEEDYKKVTDFYDSDFDGEKLKLHLRILSESFRGKEIDTNIRNVVSHLKSMSNAQLEIISEVVTLVKIILVMPATNATSKRSFSALRRIKTYLRSTMSQNRLNHLMMLYVHKELLDKLELLDIANNFVDECHERRYSIFEKFTESDKS